MQDAVVIVIRKETKYLVIKRGESQRGAGYWTPVSGRVEPGESLEETALREAMEEMGAEIHLLHKAWDCHSHDGRFHLHWFLADWISGADRPHPEEVAEYRWIDAKDFGDLAPIFEDDLRFFRKILPDLSERY